MAQVATCMEAPSLHAKAQNIADHCVAARAQQMERIISRMFNDALHARGVTSNQLTILSRIALEDGVTAAALSADLVIEKSTLSRNLKRLVGAWMRCDGPASRPSWTETPSHRTGGAYSRKQLCGVGARADGDHRDPRKGRNRT